MAKKRSIKEYKSGGGSSSSKANDTYSTPAAKAIVLNEPATKKKGTQPKEQNIFSKALDYLSAPLSQPVKTFTEGWSSGAAAVKERREDIESGKKSGIGVIATTVASTAVIGTGVLAAAGAAGAGAVGAASRSIVVGTAKKAITYATSSPINAAKTVAFTSFVAGGGLALVQPLFSAGKKATEKTVSIFTGEEEFTPQDLPAIGDSVGSAIGMGALGAAVGAAGYYLYDKFTGEPTTIDNPNAVMLLPSQPQNTGSPIAAGVPVTPNTATVMAGSSTTTRKRRYKPSKRVPNNVNNIKISFDNDLIDRKSIKRSSY